MFVLFALGIVFLSAALAEVSGVPAIIGAFFIGMVFAETRISERLEEKIVPFRDAFVAIFFVSFGMLIDPAMFGSVLWIVAIAVPLVVLNDLIITAVLSYMLGFSSRASTSMGSALCGRGAESVMYASVGSRAVGATKGAELYPFAGAFCFIMSAITPLLMRKSVAIADRLGRLVPGSVRFSGAIVSRTLGKVVMPSTFRLYKKTGKMGMALIAYFIMLALVIASFDLYHVVAFGAGIVFTLALHFLFVSELLPVVRNTSYANIGFAPTYHSQIAHFVSSIIVLSLAAIMVVAFLFVYLWPVVLVVLIAYLVAMLVLMRRNYVRTFDFVHQGEGRLLTDEAVAKHHRFEPGGVSSKVARKNRWRWL